MDNALPFDLGLLEVDQEADSQAGSYQVVETLSRMLAGEALDTLEFDHQHVFDKDVREILAD
jgi:hypothetical protein